MELSPGERKEEIKREGEGRGGGGGAHAVLP